MYPMAAIGDRRASVRLASVAYFYFRWGIPLAAFYRRAPSAAKQGLAARNLAEVETAMWFFPQFKR
jgi:hypothetical protein